MPYEKTHMLGKPHLGVSCGTGSCEFNVHETTIYIKRGAFKQKHTENKAMD